VGRFVEKKRPDITLRAFAKAARDHPQVNLDMVRDGPLLDPCRTLAGGLGVADRVAFHGALPHDKVAAHMARAEVFLQHSMTAPSGDAEGVPTSIQEAIACGMVVISTRHAGIPEIVMEGQTGFLVDEGDEEAFAAMIGKVAGSETDRAALGQRARAYAVAELDKAMLTARLERVLADAVALRRERQGAAANP
jgi:glycosyltransferase involved in cell wall biosynthesis